MRATPRGAECAPGAWRRAELFPRSTSCGGDQPGKKALTSLVPAHSRFWARHGCPLGSVSWGAPGEERHPWNSPSRDLDLLGLWCSLGTALSQDCDSVAVLSLSLVLVPQSGQGSHPGPQSDRGSSCRPPLLPPNEWPSAAHSASLGLSFPTGQRERRSACPWDGPM